MNKIIPPIQLGQQGAAVANLQEALLFIVEKRRLTPNNLSLAEWQQAVSGEMAALAFGERTKRLFAAILTDLNTLSPICTCDRNGTGAGRKSYEAFYLIRL